MKNFKDLDIKHFKFSMYLMIVSGTWRLELVTESKIAKTCYRMYTILIQSVFVCFVARLIIKLSFVWKEDKQKTIENMGVTLFGVMIFSKLMICQSKGIVNLLRKTLNDEEGMRNVTSQEDKNIYIDNAKYTFKVTAAITIYTYLLLGLPSIILNYIKYLKWRRIYQNTNSTYPKPLLMVTWYPFDEDEHYFMAFGIEAVSLIVAATYNNVTQTFFITMMRFMIGKLIILQKHFRNFDTCENGGSGRRSIGDEQAVLKNLKTLVLEHLKIMGFMKNLNESMRYLMLLEFLMVSVQIASLLMRILMNGLSLLNLLNVFALGMITNQLFLLAWNANEIKEQSTALNDALYESKWYEHSSSVRRYIHLMMIRSQRPLTLQIGPFYPMTIETVISTLKAAYSYVTIMR